VSLAGQFYALHDTHAGPPPAHRIDIWIGAYGPRMLRLIGRMADGWLPSTSYMGPDKLPDAQQIIDEAAHKAGREPTTIRRGYNISGYISTAREPFTGKTRPHATVGPLSEWGDTLLHYCR